jgi:hypothetical protein
MTGEWARRNPVIVGERQDLHVEAVVEACRHRGFDVSLVDVSTLEDRSFTYLDGEWLIGGEAFSEDQPVRRGWIRRLAPPTWRTGTQAETHEAVVRTSWLALLAGWLSSPSVQWLTAFRRLLAAENKIVQLDAVRRLGMRVPHTVLTNDLNELIDSFDEVIVKPLGPSQFLASPEDMRVVYATRMSTADMASDELASAPFLLQERIAACRHVRVVTVGGSAWVAGLDAADLPDDWRVHVPAHSSFVPAECEEVVQAAVRAATALDVHFSSQDWIVDTAGESVFLDLNPAGQWLFLPDELAQSVTGALADWLTGSR